MTAVRPLSDFPSFKPLEKQQSSEEHAEAAGRARLTSASDTGYSCWEKHFIAKLRFRFFESESPSVGITDRGLQ
ncbi:hypothetical protein P7K49_035361, partial [Saguinus oedipus]